MGDAEKKGKGGASCGPDFFPAATSAAITAVTAAVMASDSNADWRLVQVRLISRLPVKSMATPLSMP